MSTRVQRTRTREQDNKRQEARVHRKGEQESRIRWTLWDKGSRLQRTKVQLTMWQEYNGHWAKSLTEKEWQECNQQGVEFNSTKNKRKQGQQKKKTKVQEDKGQQYEVTRDKSTWVQRQGDKITSDKGKRVQ